MLFRPSLGVVGVFYKECRAMIVYKDMTFCREETCADFGDGERKCPRSLTKKVQEAAERWWGKENGGAPMDVFNKTPSCFVETKKENSNKGESEL